MTDEDNVIDAEVVELGASGNLPAVIEGETHGAQSPIEARRPQTADGRDWPHGPRPERRCTAHSSRTGEPCKNAAIKGHNVCRYHGGAAPHIKQAARIRLENAADLMAKQLLGIALTADSDGVKLAAIRDALDRAGLKAPSEVVLSQGQPKAYETVFDSIGGTPGGESPSVASGYDSAGVEPHMPPAPAYTQERMFAGGGAEAGEVYPPAAEDYQPSEGDAPPRPPGRRDRDRERQPQPRERHITGEAAMRLANQANLASGSLRAIESPHKGYRRP